MAQLAVQANRVQNLVRRNRRTREAPLSQEDFETLKKRVRTTLQEQHQQVTVDNYSGYLPAVHDWYDDNHQEVVTDHLIDRSKFYDAIDTEDGMNEESLYFKMFLETRKHHKIVDANDNKIIARIGTLSSYRSSFAYFMWTSVGKAIPLAWDQTLKGTFKVFKSREAKLKQKGVLPMHEGQSHLSVRLYHEMARFFLGRRSC